MARENQFTARRKFSWYRKISIFISIFILIGSTLCPSALASSSIQPYLEGVMEKVSEFELENGLKFLVLERHEAPVISFFTYADVGGVDEPDGKTGVAHYLEHLAFKGTSKIGTKDYAAEKQVLERLDSIYAQLQAAQAAGKTAQVEQLEAEFAQAEAEALQYVKQNEFGQIVEKSGGRGLNAATSTDYTIYFYSLPANKLELWMSLESERFLDPVFREFNKEKQIILEERRWRTDNSPIGKMIEGFLDTAYTKHPYKRPVIGYEKDIRNLNREDVREFFATYYVPSNLTIAIVGDVDPQQVKQLAQTYFGRFPAQPKPPQVTEVEPPQQQKKEINLELPSQPWYLEGYHRPSIEHPDSVVYEIITSILTEGRTSRLYKSLVEQQQIALNAEGFSGFPGDKYPNLLLFYALSAPGHSVEEIETALATEINRLKTEPVSEQELERVKNQAKASLLRTLKSNSGMARLLAEYQAKTGDWRNLFQELEDIINVTAADVQRVAQATFTPENKTIGRILPKQP